MNSYRTRWFTLLLFALLAVVAVLAVQLRPSPNYVIIPVQAQRQFPEVELPSGVLAEVYESAKPATLRIESRVPGHFGSPLGVGTGFFISPEGLLLTAYHVVDPTEYSSAIRSRVEFIAVSPDQSEYQLELIGFDAYLDLAVMRAVDASEVPYLPLSVAVPRVGSSIVAIGNSRDDFLEPRAGRVTRIGVESPRARFASNTLQLTAALAPGDSGGPVINDRGEAVAVVSYIAFNPSGDVDVPPYLRPFLGVMPAFASYASPVIADGELIISLSEGLRRDIPVIGFTGDNYLPGVGSRILGPVDLGQKPGALINTLAPDGPAAMAGLRGADVLNGIADVIIAIDDEPTNNMNDLIEVIYRKGVGQLVTVTVQRGNETFKVRLELAAKSEIFR